MGFPARKKLSGGWARRGGESPLEVARRALALPREGPPPVCLLHGEEGYLVEETARRLAEKLVPKAQREFGIEILSGPGVTAAQLSGALGSTPLFGAGPRAVWARGCGLLRARDRSEAVLRLVPDKGQGITLLITEEEVDARLALYKEIARRGAVLRFDRLSDTDDAHLRSLHALVSERLKAGGHGMERDALLYLVQLVGTDLRAIFAEIEKLQLHAAPGAKIGKGDIDLLVCPSRESTAFQLADAVTEGDPKRARLLLQQVLRGGVHPLAVLATLTQRVRFLLQLKALLDEGGVRAASTYPAFKAAFDRLPDAYREAYKAAGKRYRAYSIFGQHPYVVFKMAGAARRGPASRLRLHLDALVKADAELKREGRRAPRVLEDLVAVLCGGGAVRT